MSLALVYSRALTGIHAPSVEVEAHLANGLPAFHIVGLPEAEVKESRDRVRAAIIQSGFDFPAKKITINLAPADLPKHSGRFDLPIAIGILAASKQINTTHLERYEFIGELALSGLLRPVQGVVAMSRACQHNARSLFVPIENAMQAALVPESEIYGAKSLLEVSAHLNQQALLTLEEVNVADLLLDQHDKIDFSDVKGQQTAKTALQIAASGSHSLLMVGPPGTGKSMLASRFASILPPLTMNEYLDVAAISGLTSSFEQQFSLKRPFRSPHHSASAVALVGGGSQPRPGEISLAHHGVLFLDELPEFDRKVLEVLREPLENGEIHISRAANQVTFPAQFQLIAAMNPCPCGYLGHATQSCRCSSDSVARYQNKLSGPLLDRIDMSIHVPSLTLQEIELLPIGQSSLEIKKTVQDSRNKQLQRQGCLNAKLTVSQLDDVANIDAQAKLFLQQVIDTLHLSARAYHKILRVARTVADWQNNEQVGKEHIQQAIAFRRAIVNKTS